jgi:DNA-binding GntR family transcriptional regulator
MMVEVRHRTKTELALHVLRERILIGELEAMATTLAVAGLDAARLGRVERVHARYLDAVEAGRGTAVSKQNADWHWAIYEASGSALLLEFVRRLWKVYPWRTMWVLPGRVAQSAVEHEQIMEAIRSGNADQAGSRMGAHVGGSRDSLLARLGDTEGERE